MTTDLSGSRALWNRRALDLSSDEVLAQLMDRGGLDDWRELYRIARHDSTLRARLLKIVYQVPLPLPHFWLAALAGLGERVDWSTALPSYFECGP